MVAATEIGKNGNVRPEQRWDLKTQTTFPQWKNDTKRALRLAGTPKAFPTSTKPTANDVKQETGVGAETRSAAQEREFLRNVVDAWCDWSEKVYNVIEQRIVLGESDANHISVTFGEDANEFDGIGLWNWVVSHSNTDKESTQLELERGIMELKIAPDANSGVIDAALEKIQTDWPKVKKFDTDHMVAVRCDEPF
jgi:hypothetical protein